MTRREELEDTARALVRTFESDVEISLHERDRAALLFRITGVLLQVARECWEKNEKAARDTAFLMGNDKWRERKALLEHADWCRQQKEGLE